MTENYHFEHDGKTFTMTRSDQLPGGVYRSAYHSATPDGELWTLVEAATAGHAGSLEAIDEMPLAELKIIFEAWQKHGQAAVLGSGPVLGSGESQSSSV